MKMHAWKTGALLAAVLTTSSAFGQSREGSLIANVPFPFVAGSNKMPAGQYSIRHMNESVLQIRGTQNQIVMVPTHRAQRSQLETTLKIVFHRYEDVYFLSEVWDAPVSIGQAVPRSKAEERLAETGAEREIAVLRIP